jgi:quercetin dioxygenase-like cupin family protein
MKFTNLPESVIDWSQIATTTKLGASGVTRSRAVQTNGVQMRVVEYGVGYLADHWCAKGHILYVISGELTIDHEDGKETYELSAGMSWRSADNEGSPHRVRSKGGAKVFIVD